MRLRMFGGLSLIGGAGENVATLGKRPLALLALMAVAAERGVRREKVLAMLWPDSDEEHARNSLSQALTALRRELGANAVCAGGSELRLDSGVIGSDVQELDAAIGAGEYEQAAALFTGPFLDGVHLKASPGFEEWREEQRLRFHRMHAAVLERLAGTAELCNDLPGAVAWWRRCAALDPLSAVPALGLMRALTAMGDRAAALQHYRIYETVLRNDVGTDPDEAVAAFARRLRQGHGTASMDSGSPAIAAGSAATTSAGVDAGARRAPEPTSEGGDRGASGGDTSATPQRPRRSDRARIISTFAVAAVVIVLAATLVAAWGARMVSSAGPHVAVAPFRNLTGDSTLEAFGLLAADHIAGGLERVATAGSAVPGEGLLITGSYSREGDSILVVSRLTDRGSVVAIAEPVRLAPPSMSDGLDRVRQRALGMLAARLDSAPDLLTVGASSAPTLAAYAEYLNGLERYQRRAGDAGLPYFQRAYELDSTFVAPLIWQAFAYGAVDDLAGRRGAVRELSRHRGRLSPLDHQALLYFEASERRDLAAAAAALRRASALAPGSLWTYNVGGLMNALGRNDEAVAAFDQIDRERGWLRGWPGFWRQYARALHYVDHERELAIVREARATLAAVEPGEVSAWRVGLMLDEARALAALGRVAELEQVIAELEAARDPTRAVGFFLGQIAMELWSRGDSANSRRMLDRSLAWFRALPADEANRPPKLHQYAEALYHAGRWSEARAIFERLAVGQPQDWLPLAFVGLCAARQGDRVRAEAVMARLEAVNESPMGNLVVSSRLVYLARLAAVLGERDRAVTYIRQLNEVTGGRLSRHAQHRDFESLIGYEPYMRATSPVR